MPGRPVVSIAELSIAIVSIAMVSMALVSIAVVSRVSTRGIPSVYLRSDGYNYLGTDYTIPHVVY